MTEYNCGASEGLEVGSSIGSVPLVNDYFRDCGLVPEGLPVGEASERVPAVNDKHWDCGLAPEGLEIGSRVDSIFQPVEPQYDCGYHWQMGGIEVPCEKIRDIPLLTRHEP